MHFDEETIFHEALSRSDAVQLAVYLDGVCGGNVQLKSRVSSLLFAYTSSEFLESTPAEVDAFLTAGHHGNLDGTQIGPLGCSYSRNRNVRIKKYANWWRQRRAGGWFRWLRRQQH